MWSKTSYSGYKRPCYQAGRTTNNEQGKIELLSQWTLEAEFRNWDSMKYFSTRPAEHFSDQHSCIIIIKILFETKTHRSVKENNMTPPKSTKTEWKTFFWMIANLHSNWLPENAQIWHVASGCQIKIKQHQRFRYRTTDFMTFWLSYFLTFRLSD